MRLASGFGRRLGSRFFAFTAPLLLFGLCLAALPARLKAAEPVRLIFDTDIGNDVDDALALGVIHALESRGECKLLAVTITKDNDMSAPFVDVINTFYGRGDIPIGVVRHGFTPQPSPFTVLANQRDDGKLRYPHHLMSGQDAPEATGLLRKVLAGEPDGSVVIVQVGLATDLARLLDSKPDQYSPLTGLELAKKKVRLVSLMAGSFQPAHGKESPEYNVVTDLQSSIKLADEWPTPMVYSGFEIGAGITFPSYSILHDFNYVPHHPLADAYDHFMPPPHNRPCWDLTSALEAVRPDRGYFTLSAPGRVTVDKNGITHFVKDAGGRQRYLIANEEQRVRVRAVLATLASEPPCHCPPQAER